MEIIKIKDDEYFIRGTGINLDDTFSCGQCFRWRKEGNVWTGVAFDRVIQTEQRSDGFIIRNASYKDIQDIWLEYFDAERDYKSIAKQYCGDDFIKVCSEYGNGIHILRQEPFETILSFIISANNNIKRIQGIIDRFCDLYGETVEFGGNVYKTFPHRDVLRGLSASDIAPIRAGFRDKYIESAVKVLTEEPDFTDRIKMLDTPSAKKELCRLKGVGAKVCDCILLFAYARYEVFPKDVWIKRVVSSVYGEDFDESYFGSYAGIIQQYMFHYGRNNPDKIKNFERTTDNEDNSRKSCSA